MAGSCRSTTAHLAIAAFVLSAGWGTLYSPPLQAADPQEEAALTKAFDQQIVPLLKSYCADCHTGKKPEGKFSISGLHEAQARDNARTTWAKMLRKVRANEMPPKDADEQPKPAEREQLITWFTAQIKHIDATTPLDPGRVTMRRLNRAEYNNTIRDLVGVDFKPADDFPLDDVGYGFDNIGDVLWLPPILLEKYLSAAERILDKAIVVQSAASLTRSFTKRVDGEKLPKPSQGSNGPSADKKAYVFSSNGETRTEIEVPKDAEYTLRVRASGDQVGADAPKMEVKIDGKSLKTFDVNNKKQRGYEEKTKLTAGKHKVTVAFLNEFKDDKPAKDEKPTKDEKTAKDGKVVKDEKPSKDEKTAKDDKAAKDARVARTLYVYFVEVEGNLPADPPELPSSHKKIMIAEPVAGKKADAARKIIQNFANRAFRRNATTSEVDRLMKLWESADKGGEPFERSIQIALQAVLISPHFLFRVELDGPASSGSASENKNIRPLDDFELASRLSYFIWSSMPDDELLSLAYHGKLRQNLEAQTRRLLKDPKSQAIVENFAGQWLQTRRLENLQPDPKLFPTFNKDLRDVMRKETELFFAAIMNEDRSVLEFIDSDWTFLNERLALHYGIPGVTGVAFRKVTLPADSPRGGVLTQASILCATSNPTRTSPVKRGKWVLENLLGTPPPPPPQMFELAEDKAGELKGTLRQRMEQHRADPNCTSCHTQLDPPGFGLENFDAIGAFRTKEKGETIDASGVLPGERAFKGPKELKGLLKQQSDLFCRCLAEKMLVYALGRGVEDGDDRSVDRLVEALKQNHYKFSSLILEIAKSEPFQMRRGK